MTHSAVLPISEISSFAGPHHIAPYYNIWQHTNTREHTAIHCSILQHTATHCNTLQHSTTLYNTPQHTATHCNTLEHTATHCNTLQHTATQTPDCARSHSSQNQLCSLSVKWAIWVASYTTPAPQKTLASVAYMRQQHVSNACQQCVTAMWGICCSVCCKVSVV